jgi:hypothetical protein
VSATTRADADVRGKPLAALISAVGQSLLATDATLASTVQAELLVQFRRLTEAAKSATWIAQPADTQIATGLALRALEAAIYAESQKTRAAAVEQSIFGTITRISDAHKAQCVCAE